MTPAFWAGKRVFITGHTGFKGAWLSLWLHRLGAHVCGYALEPPTKPNMFSQSVVAEHLEHHIADIRNLDALQRCLQTFAPDIVIHMAAQAIVRESYLVPVMTYETNVMGTVNLLEAVRHCDSVKATVIVTSDKCYENRETLQPYRETDAMGGHDPYSSSKGCAELVSASYGRSFFSPQMGRGSIASVRAGNVIGGGDYAKERLMVDLMRGLMRGEDAVIRNPAAVRPWQHVLEPLSGYLAVAEHLYGNGPLPWDAWNFGPVEGSNRTVEELARMTCALWGAPSALRVEQQPDAWHEAGLLRLDSTKAQTCLGWRPRWSFETSIARTVEWYRASMNQTDMRAFTLKQIEAYEASEALA